MVGWSSSKKMQKFMSLVTFWHQTEARKHALRTSTNEICEFYPLFFANVHSVIQEFKGGWLSCWFSSIWRSFVWCLQHNCSRYCNFIDAATCLFSIFFFVCIAFQLIRCDQVCCTCDPEFLVKCGICLRLELWQEMLNLAFATKPGWLTNLLVEVLISISFHWSSSSFLVLPWSSK